MGAREVTAFLSYLATERDVAAATQQQALSALLFLYKAVLEINLPWLDDLIRPKKPARMPPAPPGGLDKIEGRAEALGDGGDLTSASLLP